MKVEEGEVSQGGQAASGCKGNESHPTPQDSRMKAAIPTVLILEFWLPEMYENKCALF